MQGFLSEDVQFKVVEQGQADGQGDPTSDSVDMQGYDGVIFVGMVGTVTATGTVTLAVEQSANDSSFAALAGASAAASDADSDRLLIIDVFRPTDRYLRTTLTRAVANSIYGGTIAILYKSRVKPSAEHAASLAANIVRVVTPAEV